MADNSEQSWTVLALINWTREHFQRSGLDEPRLAAEMLLSHVLECERIELYARFNHEPDDQQKTAFRELVKRAADHEPVAYLVGWKEFYSLRLAVNPDVLVPRCETEILVTEALTHLKNTGSSRVWDVCTGSGCVAVAIASQAGEATVLATDISPEAIAVAEKNIATLGLADRVTCKQADLLNIKNAGEFDVITANPPYVAEGEPVADEVRHEPHIALYADDNGLKCIDAIVGSAPDHLRSGGALIMEFGYRQGDIVRQLIEDSPDFGRPRIIQDHQAIQRVVVALRK